MPTLRAFAAATVWLTAVMLPLRTLPAAVPEYKLGDVVEADVVTPVPLVVLNPEATETLKQKVTQQVHLIVLHQTTLAAEVEKELREKIVATRTAFMTALRREDLESSTYTRLIKEISPKVPKDFPFDQLAPLWGRGQGGDEVIEQIVRAVVEVMAQPIVKSKTETPLPTSQPVRVVPVTTLQPPPAVKELENAGTLLSSGRVLSLWRARQLVEANFTSGRESLGKFAASFVQTNAFPESSLTEKVRAARAEGVAVNDTYEAAQVVVRKGQVIDRKALNALAAVREKSMIGTLQVKLEQEQAVAGQIQQQTKWFAIGLGAVGLVLVFVLWRLRPRPAGTLSPILINRSLDGPQARALPSGTVEEAWRTRALLAEDKAERAHQAIRSGVMGWMKERIFGAMFRQREELLSAQQKAEIEIRELEQRLEDLHAPLQERISAYEQRIEELEKDLAAKGEENRELIGARIHVTKQHLRVERERNGFSVN